MRKPLFALLFLLLLTLLACSLSPAATPAPSAEDAIATAVAATLAADTPATSATPPTEVSSTSSVEPPAPPRAVYVLEGNVWLWQPGDPTFQLTTSGDTEWVRLSSDGQLVALLRTVARDVEGTAEETWVEEIWVVNIDGSDLRCLVSAEDIARLLRPADAVDLNIAQMDWVPGTHTLAYATMTHFDGPGVMLSNDLRLIDVDTLTERTFLEPGLGGRFVFSPDGTRVAVVLPTQIDLLWLDGSTPRRHLLTYPMVSTASEFPFIARPQWSRDGSYLLVFIPPVDPLAVTPQPSTVWRLPVDGSPASQIAAFTTARYWGVSDPTPLFDPTLNYLAYMTEEGEEGEEVSLHVAALDGSGDIVLASAPQISFFGWAPLGQRFTYAAGDAPPLLVRVDGSTSSLTDDGLREVRRVVWVTDDIFLLGLGHCATGGCNWQLRFDTLSSSGGLLATTTNNYGISSIDVTR